MDEAQYLEQNFQFRSMETLEAEETKLRSFDDSYIKEKRLGKGGFGFVYQVQEKDTLELYAMKEVSYTQDMSERDRARQNTELKILSKVNHPKCCQIPRTFFQYRQSFDGD